MTADSPTPSASASKKPEIVKLLLERGAKIDVKDDQGNSPLSFAEKLNPEIYKILKEAKRRTK
jgi:ankyrin repeat protein